MCISKSIITQSPSEQYYKPNLLVRLIGPYNEAPVQVEGVQFTGLINLDAQMSSITTNFAEKHEIPIYPFRLFVKHRR